MDQAGPPLHGGLAFLFYLPGRRPADGPLRSRYPGDRPRPSPGASVDLGLVLAARRRRARPATRGTGGGRFSPVFWGGFLLPPPPPPEAGSLRRGHCRGGAPLSPSPPPAGVLLFAV